MSTEIKLPENLTIHHIDNHFNELNKLFDESEDEIKIEASAVETIDSAGLQTLLILIKNSLDNDKTISWENTSDIVQTSSDRLGLSQALLLPS
ncbi:MAG: STAS domain-containing protein [Thiomicrorhabdus sp.]|nr:STAS domain-containing protein [Thiomicrorhabdus sp.]